MSRPVLHEPNSELRKVSEPVSLERIGSPEFALLITELEETMKKENGVGIAAPQIGVHDRVILVDDDGIVTAYINPMIIERSFRMIASEEGCLSVPGCFGIVKRHRSVSVSAILKDGTNVRLKAQGFLATVFQHEIDHLDGILFIDRAERVKKTSQL